MMMIIMEMEMEEFGWRAVQLVQAKLKESFASTEHWACNSPASAGSTGWAQWHRERLHFVGGE